MGDYKNIKNETSVFLYVTIKNYIDVICNLKEELEKVKIKKITYELINKDVVNISSESVKNLEGLDLYLNFIKFSDEINCLQYQINLFENRLNELIDFFKTTNI